MSVNLQSSRNVAKLAALLAGFVIVSYAGIRFVRSAGWALIMEVTYLLVVLIVFAVVYDRVLVQ